MGIQWISWGSELLLNRAEVVDFAVEHDPDLPVGRAQRLLPPCEVDDAEPAVAHNGTAEVLLPMLVRPPVTDGGIHSAEHGLIRQAIAGPGISENETTHDVDPRKRSCATTRCPYRPAWRGRSAHSERKPRLHRHDASLRDGSLRGKQRLRRHEEALGVIHCAGRTGKLGDHCLEHRLLAEIGLELTHAASRAAAKDELAKTGDLGRTPATEDINGFAFQAFLAAAHVVHHADAPACET